MGKPESSKNSNKKTNTYRKSLLGSSTLAIFLQPTALSHFPVTSQKYNEEKKKTSDFSAKVIYELLKDANKIMVKGAKLYESLNELKLSGWINPYTLLLSGLSEDMKIVKRAWVKRQLKNPEDFFITDVGKYILFLFMRFVIIITHMI